MNRASWLLDHKGAVLADWFVAVGTIVAAVVAVWIAVCGNRREDKRRREEEAERRRNDSRLGIIIVKSLVEEVAIGVGIMKGEFERITIKGCSPQPVLSRSCLPWASWEGQQTFPNGVLLRIMATCEGLQACDGPPVTDIVSHCKDYFVRICTEYNETIRMREIEETSEAKMRRFDSHIKELLRPDGTKRFIKVGENVLKMLEQTRALLEQNAKSDRPR